VAAVVTAGAVVAVLSPQAPRANPRTRANTPNMPKRFESQRVISVDPPV
jgi:hypothetical protein